MSLSVRRSNLPKAARPALGVSVLAIVLTSCGGTPPRIHAIAELPDHFAACGRTWIKDALERTQSLGEIRQTIGVDPVAVDPNPLTACPAGACTTVAQDGPCHTVIYVRVGEDVYLGYELSGGP